MWYRSVDYEEKIIFTRNTFTVVLVNFLYTDIKYIIVKRIHSLLCSKSKIKLLLVFVKTLRIKTKTNVYFVIRILDSSKLFDAYYLYYVFACRQSYY